MSLPEPLALEVLEVCFTPLERRIYDLILKEEKEKAPKELGARGLAIHDELRNSKRCI